MSLRVTFEVSARDLKHFRREMKRAREAVRIAEDEEIIRAAQHVLESIRDADRGDLVQRSIRKIDTMIAIIEDKDWRMPGKERTQILSALAYFGDPDDLIPDDIPGIGFLDDAIIVELVFRDLRHDVTAYKDFCTFRNKCLNDATLKRDPVALEKALEKRQRQLHQRVRRRRQKDRENKSAPARSLL